MLIRILKNMAAIAIIAMLPFNANSQDSALGNWLIYIGSKKLTPKLNLHHEIQYRNYDAIGDLEQLLIRTGLGYNLTENNNNLLLGYGFIHSQNYGSAADQKTKVDEHRIFQQFITKQKIGSFGLQHRYRFEQRFVADDFKLRFRYFLGLNLPIKESPIYLSGYNEIFLNTDGSAFDRNRLYSGLGYKLKKTFRVEVGYMNQFFEETGRDQFNLLLFANF